MRWVPAAFFLLGSHSATPSYTPVSGLRYFPSYATNNASLDWSSALPREGEASWGHEGNENAETAQDEGGRSYPGNLVNFGSNNLNQLASIPSSLYESFVGDANSGSRLGSASISPSTVYTGVFDPNNILIHVSQNFVNFAVSTIAWMVFVPFFTGTSREGRSMEGSSWMSWLSGHSQDVPWALRRIADTAEVFNQLKDEL